MGDFITYEKIPERAVLIAVASKQQGRERTEEYHEPSTEPKDFSDELDKMDF